MTKPKAKAPAPAQPAPTQEEANKFKDKFATRFSADELRTIYDEEIKRYPNFERDSTDLEKKKDPRDSDFTTIIPKTIQYVKDNIFHSADGDYYVMTYNKESGYFPQQYSKDIITNNTFVCFFPPLVKKWWKTYSKLYYITIDMKQGRVFSENGTNYLNLFNGFPDDTVPRNPETIKQQADNIKFWWNHVKTNLCSSDERVFKELHSWQCAFIGGRRKMTTAPVLKGKYGAGKSAMGELNCRLVGTQNFVRISNANDILGTFNGHLAGKLFVYIDDIPLKPDQYALLYEALKVPITESTNAYRDLFKRSITLQNLNTVFITANRDILKVEAQAGKERRILNCDVNPIVETSESFWDRLWNDCIKSVDFRRAFLWYCQDNYDPKYNEQASLKTIPMTKSAIHSIQFAITPKIEFFRQKALTEDEDTFNKPRKPQEWYDSFCEFYNKNENYDKKRLTPARVWKEEIKEEVFLEHKSNYRMEGQAPTNWIFSNRKKCLDVYLKRGFITEDDLIENELQEVDMDDDIAELEIQLQQMKNDALQLEQLIKKKKALKELIEKKKTLTKAPTIDVSKNIVYDPSKKLNTKYVVLTNQVKRLKEQGEDARHWEEELKTTKMYVEPKGITMAELIQQAPEPTKKEELITIEHSDEEENKEEEEEDEAVEIDMDGEEETENESTVQDYDDSFDLD